MVCPTEAEEADEDDREMACLYLSARDDIIGRDGVGEDSNHDDVVEGEVLRARVDSHE